MTMATTIDQQVALDEALVPSTQRLRIGRMTANVPEIYMQEFWSTIKLHQCSIRFKMDTRKHVLDLEAFREMLHITPKPKSSARKKKGDYASFTTPPTLTPTTTVVAAPRLSATAKGKQPARATTPTEPTDVERTEAKQLKIVLKRSRQETHISQQRGFGTDEGTGSRPGVLDVPSDDSEEELSWNSSDDEDVDEQTKGREENEEDKTDESDDRSDDDNDDDNDETVKAGSERDEDDDDNDDEEELAKKDDEDTESGKGGDEVSESEKESDKEEETRQEEEETFRFDERLRSLETTFSEYRQTNPFVDAVSAIPGIVHQYMTQQMTEAVREAV
nr:hypothetical protein [Tanacetum cinerariifolium]